MGPKSKSSGLTFVNAHGPVRKRQYRRTIKPETGELSEILKHISIFPTEGSLVGRNLGSAAAFRPKASQEQEESASRRARDGRALERRIVDPRGAGELVIDKSFAGLRTDPFRALPIPGLGDTSGAIDLARTWQATRLPVSASIKRSSQLLTKLYSAVLQNLELLCTQLATAQLERSQFGTSGMKEMFRYRGSAISGLQRKVTGWSGPCDDAMIMTALCLVRLDMILVDGEGLRAHMRGFRQMVASRGGISKLQFSFIVKGVLFQIEDYDSYHDETDLVPTITDRAGSLTYPQHPFSPDLCAQISTLPTGFSEPVLQQHISFEVFRVLQRISDWYRMVEQAQQTPSAFSPEQKDHIFQYDALTDIAEVEWCLKKLTSSVGNNSLEECLCQGLVLHGRTMFSQVRLGIKDTGTNTQVAAFILKFEPGDSAARDCLIWTWVQAIEKRRFGRYLMPQGAFLITQLFERYPELMDLDQLELVLRRFFWNDVLELGWRECFYVVLRDLRLKVVI